MADSQRSDTNSCSHNYGKTGLVLGRGLTARKGNMHHCLNYSCIYVIQARVLRLVPPVEMKNTILGQYSKSEDGEKPGYKDDDTVPEDSRCATFCTTVAYVKNARWEGVPFILKAGKGKTPIERTPGASSEC